MYRKHADPSDKSLDKYPQWCYAMLDWGEKQEPFVKKFGKYLLCGVLLYVAVSLFLVGVDEIRDIGRIEDTTEQFIVWAKAFGLFAAAFCFGYYPVKSAFGVFE